MYLQLAQQVADMLNKQYEESIFSIAYGSDETCATIVNDKYRYEGNDVNISFDSDGIVGTVTGSTVQFSSTQDVLDNIDQLFINEVA